MSTIRSGSGQDLVIVSDTGTLQLGTSSEPATIESYGPTMAVITKTTNESSSSVTEDGLDKIINLAIPTLDQNYTLNIPAASAVPAGRKLVITAHDIQASDGNTLTITAGGGVIVVPSKKFEVDTSTDVNFEKDDNAGVTGSAVDYITGNVAIARDDEANPIFNSASELFDSDPVGPKGTLWAIGTIAGGGLSWDTFKSTLGGSVGSNILDSSYNPMVMHMTDEDVYVDVEFTSWTSGGAGGGFAYTRSAVNEIAPTDSIIYAGATPGKSLPPFTLISDGADYWISADAINWDVS